LINKKYNISDIARKSEKWLYIGLIVMLGLELINEYIISLPYWLKFLIGVLALVFLAACITIKIAAHRHINKK